MEKIINVVGGVGKFMKRYAGEASRIADVFRTILQAVPIDAQDKAKVEKVIEDLDAAADRIADYLNENPMIGEPITVKASDVEKAIAKYLDANPGVIAAALAKANEGNGDA